MVFGLLEGLLGRQNDHQLWKDKTVLKLMEEGMSKEESERVGWLLGHQRKGKGWGVVVGMLLAGGCHYNHSYLFRNSTNLKLYLNKHTNYLLYLAFITYLGYSLPEYLVTNTRYGANSMVANYYNNNHFIFAKNKFIQEYRVMNRKFSKQEVECFVENIDRRAAERDQSLQRKYIYNPALHGPDQEGFEKMVREYMQDNVDPVLRPGVQEHILQHNVSKLQQGEHLVIKPHSVNTLIDPTGILYGLKFNSWTKGWNLL